MLRAECTPATVQRHWLALAVGVLRSMNGSFSGPAGRRAGGPRRRDAAEQRFGDAKVRRRRWHIFSQTTLA